MKKLKTVGGLLTVIGVMSVVSQAADETRLIDEQKAIQAALAGVDVEVLGIRFDEPDTQWDVFVKVGTKAYEVEINASNGAIVAVEEESLAEVQAELSGNLSHEGVAGDVD